MLNEELYVSEIIPYSKVRELSEISSFLSLGDKLNARRRDLILGTCEFFGIIGVSVATKNRSGSNSYCNDPKTGQYLDSFCYIIVVFMLVSLVFRVNRLIFLYPANKRTTK